MITKLNQRYPAIAQHLWPFAKAGRKRGDQGDYWWELRPCSYYADFSKPKIFWNDITKLPRFSWDEKQLFTNQKGYFIPDPHPSY